ncbi:MAG: DUF2786 domain-containing protein [Rhodocyclaceae bacterium]|nr:DUF2786 domain-containing protein [Rhodocyclaceae bacterium]
MANQDDIIAKIKKCLALSRSSNEHEAAAALRQAQKLMEAHGIDEGAIADSEISESLGRSGAGARPPKYETALALAITGAFGCEEIFKPWSGWLFIGAGPAPEIAQYAFEVLYRQVKRARAAHIKVRLSRCGSVNKTRRADIYCDGWVSTAVRQLQALAVGQEQQAKIAGYIERRYEIETFTSRDRQKGRNLSERDLGDWAAGRDAGHKAELNRGVSGHAAPLALE